jgi:predicted nuclease of predicted toxin-antitoxin system
MQFKIDENLPVEAAELLREAGYDTITVLEQHLGGHADPEIASVCQQETRCLLTLDKDFADIRTYPPEHYSGFIVLRLQQQDKAYVLRMIQKLLTLLLHESPTRHLWIVEEGRIRIRGTT